MNPRTTDLAERAGPLEDVGAWEKGRSAWLQISKLRNHVPQIELGYRKSVPIVSMIQLEIRTFEVDRNRLPHEKFIADKDYIAFIAFNSF